MVEFIGSGGPVKLGPKSVIPSYTTAQRLALTKVAGLMVLDTTLNRFYIVDAALDWKYCTLN